MKHSFEFTYDNGVIRTDYATFLADPVIYFLQDILKRWKPICINNKEHYPDIVLVTYEGNKFSLKVEKYAGKFADQIPKTRYMEIAMLLEDPLITLSIPGWVGSHEEIYSRIVLRSHAAAMVKNLAQEIENVP